MYKNWRLRNSSELWQPNTRSKQSSGNGTILLARTREKHQSRDDNCPSQAGPKPQQKNSRARGLLRDENLVSSNDALDPSVRSSKVSPCRISGGQSILHHPLAVTWTDLAHRDSSMGECDAVNLDTVQAQNRKLLQTPNKEEDANGQEQAQSDESDGPKTPRRHEYVGQLDTTIVLPVITVRDIAVHLEVEDAQEQARQDGNNYTLVEWGSSTSSSSNNERHLQWQVPHQQLPCSNSSTEEWTDLGHEESSREECDPVHLDTDQAQNREMNWTPSKQQDYVDGTKVALEQKSDQPLNKFIIGGPLHALVSLTQLNLSELNKPRASTRDLQQELEENSPVQEQSAESLVGSLVSFNSGPSLPEKPGNKRFFPTGDSQGGFCISKLEEQSVLMRANVTYESVVKGVPPIATSKTVPLRKKIKMKAPTPKLSSRAKKPIPNAGDAKDISVIQADEQLKREENRPPKGCSSSDCKIVDTENVQSLQGDEQIPMDAIREDEKIIPSIDHPQPNTCVVTHCEHNIDVPELQDPPSRRRWPKVLSTFTSISSQSDTLRSSTSSTCESLQEENIPIGLHCPNLVKNCDSCDVQTEDSIEGQAMSHSSTDASERITINEDISVEANSEQFKEGLDKAGGKASRQPNLCSDVATVFKTGLRISVPSALVREISINSTSNIQQRKLPDLKQHQDKDSESKMLGNEFQSTWEIPSSLPGESPGTGCLCRAQCSGWQDEVVLDCPCANPQHIREDPLDKSSMQGDLVSNKNSKILEAIDPSALSLTTSSMLPVATNSPGQPRQTTQESIKFGRGVWSATPHHEEKYAERASLSSKKLCNILSYLGHVEESNLQENYNILQKTKPKCYSPNSSRSPRIVLEHDDSISLADSAFTTTLTNVSNWSATNSNVNSGDGDGHPKSTTSLFEGVRKKIQHYKDRITGQESRNALLIKELEQVRVDKEQALSLEREKFGKELEIRATEYKTVIQHHLALNEKMIKDKEALSKKCCSLVGTLSTAESKLEEKLKVVQERAAQDLKKQREIWIAGEKPRREAWKEAKLKEIKEITIKGLEPHIEGIVEKHKQDMQKIETRCVDETHKRLELQAIQHRREMSELRERLLKDRDDLLEKEKMSALQRMNEVAEKYEQQAMQLRMRVSGDMAAELERVEEIRRKDKHEAHELLSKFQKEAAEREDTLRKGLENAMHVAISKRDDEIVKLKNSWQKALDEKLQEEMQIKETELQARCTKERDEQIEMIIEKMDVEKEEAVTQQQQDLLVKVECLMEEKLDFMKRIKDVESKCATLCQLSLEAKQNAETELDNRDMQIKSLERELACQSDVIEQLQAQMNEEKNNFMQREECFEIRIKKEKELLQSTLAEVDRCNVEAQQMRARKVEELAGLEAQVRQAIDNKDLVIAGLREQLLSAKEQIRHTKQLLSS
ncbi:unnamed protein product [Calypogeia fissa]